MSIERNEHQPWWCIMVYGVSSLIDGGIMLASFGLFVGTYRHECSLWMARRYARSLRK